MAVVYVNENRSAKIMETRSSKEEGWGRGGGGGVGLSLLTKILPMYSTEL